MALTELQKETIRTLVSANYKSDDNPKGLSNYAIAAQAVCSESAVRTLIKKENLKKNAINALAKDEADTIIKRNEIEVKKNALTNAEKNAYDKVLLTEVQSRNLVMNANHALLKKIHTDIEDGMKVEKINVGDGMQQFEPVAHGSSDHVNHAKAIQTVSDNLGITQRHSSSQVVVNNQNNNTQNIDIELTEDEAKQKALDLGVPLSVLTSH